ncbi:hypothetical protein PN36_26610 [Candidatus Thiomargarita nelsonii]|uniref:PIN domain-containing protein n=1 Tax=Candidatus Thiomargarita nelsonii TaxID=1003181 RepID=A0A0A6P8C5_9GAMM|nr:hypothetical protein PN36_26610 [Candidatus Thiomargarita nelsonii]
MKAFLDTSSLLKLYHYESGTETLNAALSQGVDKIYLSELARLEFRSAIWKKTRTGEIDTDTANAVITCFQQDNVKFQWIYLENDVIQSAEELLMKYGQEGLRTLDAIQLASALTLKEQQDIRFFTADQLLKSFFKQEGLKET